MARPIGIIREFNTTNFKVIVDALPEEDLDLSFDETGETAAKLDSGDYVAFVARARVLFHGAELASDYLGNCIYESLEAFMDHRGCGIQNRGYEAAGTDGRCGSYFSDMVHNVCKDARKELESMQLVKIRAVK